MAISYFKSSQVHVFPCAYRGTSAQNAIDPEARLNTEKNLTNTGNNLKGTYLISKTTSGTVTKVNVVIEGYYFELNMDTSVSGNITWDSLKNKYLAIKTIDTPIVSGGKNTRLLAKYDGTATTGEYLDVGEVFKGLAICETDTEVTSATAKIKIADSNGNVLNDAYLPDISSSTGSKSLASSGCTAAGDYATAFGKGLVGTTTAGQMVIGKYNADATGKLFVVGKGTDASTGRSNAFTVNTDGNTNVAGTLEVTGNTTIGSTLGVTGAATLSSTLSVNGVTTLSGNATLSGNTTLNAIANKDTTLANGSLFLGNGGTNGSISSSGNGVFGGTDGVVTNKLQAFDSNITLASSLIPTTAGTINLGSYDKTFDSVWADEFRIPWGTLDEGLILSRNGTTEGSKVYSRGTLTLDCNSDLHLTTSNNTKYVYSDKKFIASAGLEVSSGSGSLTSYVPINANAKINANAGLNANSNITIASGHFLDLSGSSTGNIKVSKVTTSNTSSVSFNVPSAAIYSITAMRSSDESPSIDTGRTISVTMMLSNAGTFATKVYSPESQSRNTGINYVLIAERASTGATTWTIKLRNRDEGETFNCNFTVARIAVL